MTPGDLTNATIHASAVLVGAKAVLIRGASGSGKSRLAWDLIRSAGHDALPFARLVADDRVFVEAHNGQVLVRPASSLAGMIEIFGLGIRKLPFEPVAAVGLVVDLGAADAERMPAEQAGTTVVSGVPLPRLSVATGMAALPLVLAFLSTTVTSD